MNKVTMIENPETKDNKENKSSLNFNKIKTGRVTKTKQDLQGGKKAFEVSKVKVKQNLDKSKNITEKKKQAASDLENNLNVTSQLGINLNQDPNKTNTNSTLKEVDYLARENDKLIRGYGSDLFDYSKELDNVDIPPKFMARHNIDPDIRIKMVDWMVEVLSVYKSEDETFFLAVRVMDMFIYKSNTTINTNDIHLLGIVSMFIASKFEDIFPIRIESVQTRIGHNLFSDKVIRKKERQILSIISFDDLITTSMYEFVKTLFYDFKHNNMERIIEYDLDGPVSEMERASIYLTKLIVHFEDFYQYRHSHKAIGCIACALKIMRLHSSRLTKERDSFLVNWINFLISESNTNAEKIQEICIKISQCYYRYDTLKSVSQNLNKFYELSFK